MKYILHEDFILRSIETKMDHTKDRIEILKAQRQKLYDTAALDSSHENDVDWNNNIFDLNDRIKMNEKRLSKLSNEYAEREQRLQAIDASEYSSINASDLAPKIAAGLVIATVIVGLGYKIYKRKFSQAAKACSRHGISYRQKSICMLKYQISAFEQEIKFLNSSSQKCSKSKDPEKCKSKINERIAKLTYKIRNTQAKIMHLEAKEKLKARESYEVKVYLTLMTESKRVNEIIDPIVTPIVLGSLAAAGTGMSVSKMIIAKRKRKQCIKFASDIEDPEERKKAYVRCYQAGTD